MSYTLVLEWMPGDLYMSAVTARCTAPTSSYSVVWLPPNKVYQITLYCGSTSLVSFLVGAFRGKAWSYMKNIHPDYQETTITCACGNVIHTRSTKKDIRVEICSKCHPFYTGKQKLVDTSGRVDMFKKRYGITK